MAKIVPLKLKRKLGNKGHDMHEYICPKMDALQWLKQSNPLNKDITISQDWECLWKDNDPDLWQAIASACHEERDIVFHFQPNKHLCHQEMTIFS